MKIAEYIIASIVFFSLVYMSFIGPEFNGLLVLSLITLSIIYFPFGSRLFLGFSVKKVWNMLESNEISRKTVLILAGTGLASSICLYGIMFQMFSWPGASFNLGFGLITSCAMAALIVRNKPFELNLKIPYIKTLIRVAILIILGIATFLIEQ